MGRMGERGGSNGIKGRSRDIKCTKRVGGKARNMDEGVEGVKGVVERRMKSSVGHVHRVGECTSP